MFHIIYIIYYNTQYIMILYNMVAAILLVFLAVVWAEIVTSDMGGRHIDLRITRLPVMSSTTPLNSWTSQTFV